MGATLLLLLVLAVLIFLGDCLVVEEGALGGGGGVIVKEIEDGVLSFLKLEDLLGFSNVILDIIGVSSSSFSVLFVCVDESCSAGEDKEEGLGVGI